MDSLPSASTTVDYDTARRASVGPAARPRVGTPRRVRSPAWLWLIAGATGAGLIFGAQIYYSSLAADKPVGWAQALYWSFRDWYEWALLSPLIFWMCRRFRIETRTWPLSVPVFAVSAVLFTFAHAVMCAGAAALLCAASGGEEIHWVGYTRAMLAERSPFNFAVFLMIICAWHAWDYYQRFRKRDAQLAAVEQQLAEAQLFALRMQLNPHFLCNALNAVSSLMLRDVRAANQMLARLGSLLREVLENVEQTEISLEREIELASKYLDVEQVRFGDRLRVEIAVPSSLHQAAVPPFILQPLLENALRHALEHRRTGGRIQLAASRHADALVLRLSDNGGDQPQGEQTASTRGRREPIGLNNTRQRLEKLYGQNQSLQLVRNDNGGCTVEVRMPFRELDAPLSEPSFRINAVG